MDPDWVLKFFCHTFGTRLGETGADAFAIMQLMGHSTVTVSQRYVHPSVSFGYHAAADPLRFGAHPAKQGTLSRIRALKAEGCTPRQIAHELNRQGSTTGRGAAWRFQHVAQALGTG
jgi:hypothetical protein